MRGIRSPAGPGGLLVTVCLLACVDLERPAGLVAIPPQNQVDAAGPGQDADGDRGSGPEAGDGQGGDRPTLEVAVIETLPALEVGEAAPAPAPAGSACQSGSACASGACADGVCCDQSCTGICVACNLPGKVGTCSPVAEGQDPGSECEEQPVQMCRQDGTCDGRGACRHYPAGTQCAPGSCANATEYAASVCAGVGACQAGASRSCAPGVCAGSSCRSSCSGPADCQAGFYCDTGTCRAKAASGASCGAAVQCGSGFCVDGVCCAVACAGQCQACNLPGKLGMCAPVASGEDPAQECPAAGAGTCGNIGGCNGAGACRLEPAGAPCGAGASCTGGTATSARTCNGAGVCQSATSTSCGAYQCSGTTCAQSCASAAACRTGYKCASAACLPLKITGLTVHDTSRAAGWGVRLDFRIGSGGAHPWKEWPNSYVTGMDPAGSVLLGNEWTAVATDSKEYTGGPQATLSLGAAAEVYLMVDDRWGGSPSWTSGWSNTGWNIQVYESSSRPSLAFSVFRRAVSGPASISLPQIGSTTAYNYFVVVY